MPQIKPRWANEEIVWRSETHPNAPCYNCVYRGKDANNDSCLKYPVLRRSIGAKGKPKDILAGKSQCSYYQPES